MLEEDERGATATMSREDMRRGGSNGERQEREGGRGREGGVVVMEE